MGFDYPQHNGFQVGTDFDGSTLYEANYLGGQANVPFPRGSLGRRWFYTCGERQCRRAGDGQTTFFLDPHNAPFNRHVPELYSFELLVQMPYLTDGTLGCKYVPALPTLPATWACGPEVDHAYYEGFVAGGVFLDHSGVTIDPGFTSQPAPGGAINSRPWPNYDIYDPGVVQSGPNPSTALLPYMAYLENPDPVWPVPDAQGSTFGRVLFTLAQLPWEISVTFIHHAHDHAPGTTGPVGSMNGTVRGYVRNRPLQTIATIAAGPGEAGFRPRGMIVGKGHAD